MTKIVLGVIGLLLVLALISGNLGLATLAGNLLAVFGVYKLVRFVVGKAA